MEYLPDNTPEHVLITNVRKMCKLYKDPRMPPMLNTLFTKSVATDILLLVKRIIIESIGNVTLAISVLGYNGDVIYDIFQDSDYYVTSWKNKIVGYKPVSHLNNVIKKTREMLTPETLESLDKYMDRYYKDILATKRYPEKVHEKKWVDAYNKISNAIEITPTPDYPYYVTRGESLYNDVKRIGSTWTIPTFISTSSFSRSSLIFTYKGCCLYVFKLPAGYPSLTLNEKEYEVLIGGGAVVEVEDILIYMDEGDFIATVVYILKVIN
jgi:hypothetical protein